MKYSRVLLGFLVFVFALSAFGQKLVEKPLNKWSKDDAIRLLNDSGWAKSYQSTSGSSAAAAGQIAREQSQTSSSGGSNPRSVARDFGPPPVYMRLHSAMPVRQAMVRLRQIAAEYDKMSEADRTAFDTSQQKFLECAICKDYYVITLVRAPDASRSIAEEGIFQGMTLEQLKGNVKLINDKGEERELIQFNAPKSVNDAAVFYFKRTDDAGNMLLNNDSKTVRFQFDSTFLDAKNRFAYLVPRTFEFKVSSMIIGDKLSF